ncbi:MAG: AzlD domain-containing protein [Synergistaceae bacterium]|nr:AzlD domain-containing protein [Synergistaceae bacterium]MBR0075566.1 AzlD domain-containing protein [Synergistaceae bacterium]MBR0234506.1 AzlD domain-containing protein [Synergistaceae bacterium]MBR0254128.1 AzlD domain-containing protein [Synergistaceae bacterium]
MFDIHAGYVVIISGALTALLRFIPFIAFRKKRPEFILYLGRVLPYSVMTMLGVYCLKGVNLLKYPNGLPEFIAGISVILLHSWRRNTLLSITLGTIFYMVLVQFVF